MHGISFEKNGYRETELRRGCRTQAPIFLSTPSSPSIANPRCMRSPVHGRHGPWFETPAPSCRCEPLLHRLASSFGGKTQHDGHNPALLDGRFPDQDLATRHAANQRLPVVGVLLVPEHPTALQVQVEDALEVVVLGVGFGALAIGWPLVSRDFVTVLALWAAATGLLEILMAALMPRQMSAHWLIGTAGVLSVFLAVLVFMVRHADSPPVVELIAGYTVGFGMLLAAAALQFRTPRASRAARPERA